MAHFAKIDENNTVTQVIVVSNDDIKDVNGVEVEEIGVAFCKKLFGADTNWKQTSYNNNFRVRYAGIGYSYNETLNAFIPPKPHDSWILNTTIVNWEAPVSQPNLTNDQIENGYYYSWVEEELKWKLKSINLYIQDQPHPSWSFNLETDQWESPIGPAPTLTEQQLSFGLYYTWNEESGVWVLNTPEEYNPDGDDGLVQDGTPFERSLET